MRGRYCLPSHSNEIIGDFEYKFIEKPHDNGYYQSLVRVYNNEEI